MNNKKLIEKFVSCNIDLSGADFSGANLQGANLQHANLQDVNLRDADLRYANLRGAILSGANLRGANLGLMQLLLINWGELSNRLTLECMRQDAVLIGIEKMDIWANGGSCPYEIRERELIFNQKCELWESGKPEMSIGELIFALCKEKNIIL